MAYLDLTLSPAFSAPMPVQFNAPPPSFEQREWAVVGFARMDGLSSLRKSTHIEQATAWLFGRRINRRLADPRLEVLRRLAVLAWHHGYAVPVSAIDAFKNEGFSVDQLEILFAGILAERTQAGRETYA